MSMFNKKNARLIRVKYFCCICFSHQVYCFFIELDNDWIKSGFNRMNRHGVAICGTETIAIKTVFLLWQE